MKSFLQNSKISNRIWIAFLLPMMGMVFFSGYSAMQKQSTMREMSELTDVADLAPVISAVVHELQKERGTSAVFLGSKGKVFADLIVTQTSDTNKKLADLEQKLALFRRESHDAKLMTRLDAAQAALEGLTAMRAKVIDAVLPQHKCRLLHGG